jgi:transposase-like protein
MVIDILFRPKRDRWAALRFFRRLLDTAQRAPLGMVTDKLRSYAAAKKLICLTCSIGRAGISITEPRTHVIADIELLRRIHKDQFAVSRFPIKSQAVLWNAVLAA